MKLLLRLPAMLLLCITLCSNTLAADIGYGRIADGVYSNTYFDMSIAVPDGWSVQSKASMQTMSERGGNLIAGEDKSMQAVMKESEKQSVNLFGFFKYEQGSPVDFNPSIIAVAERVNHLPGIKRGADYLFHVKKILNASPVDYRFSGKMGTQTLSGVSFDVMPSTVNIGGNSLSQEYYATRIKDYVLSFVLSYSTDAERKELIATLTTLTIQD